MIDFIAGIIAEKTPTRLVVENAGFGLDLLISTNTYKDLPAVGDKVKLRTYLHVREDSLQLFAFSDENERNVFTSLLSVSGIGPRLAQTILSGMRYQELITAIQGGDLKALTSISGVGTKTAQRMIIELKEKFSLLGLIEDKEPQDFRMRNMSSVEEEALLALISLGYKRYIVEKALNKVREKGDYHTVEALIKEALQVI
jgi:Holliday junction DNA helicase RuvA